MFSCYANIGVQGLDFVTLLTESSLLPTTVFDCQAKMHLLAKERNECMVNCGLKEKFLVKTLTSKNKIFRIT